MAPAQLFLVADPTASTVGFDYTYLAPVVALGVSFGASYTRLEITFNQPTDGDVGGQRVPCSTLLDSTTLAVLGAGASTSTDGCLWNTPSALFVLLGRGYTARLLTPITLKSNSLLPRGSSNTALSLASSPVEIQDDANAALPEAKVSAPISLGFCDALTLDGSGSSGIGLSYAWECTNCDATLDAALLQELPGITSARAVLASDLFSRADMQFDFALTVTDFVGRSSSQAVARVLRSSLSLPQISVDGPSTVDVDARFEVSVGAFAEFSACAAAQKLSFSWKQLRVSGDTEVTNFAGQDGRLMIIST